VGSDWAQRAPGKGGRIEGGVDAVVVGASFDGFVAAALLGKAGLKTVLLGAGGAALQEEPREFWGGYFSADGDHLVTHLDPQLIASLDLYRHGLEYAARRLDSVYFFADGGALLLNGDLYRSRESVVAMAEHDGERFADFLETALDAARALRPFFDGGDLPALVPPLSVEVERFLSASLTDILDGAFDDPHLRALLTADALLATRDRPGDAFSFAALLKRWSGEVAGLQGGVAIAAGGAVGVNRAVRRAAQAARVDLRPAAAATRVLVESDAAAGVETVDGGQVRAPIVVNALSARQAFLDCVGPALLDVGFQSAVAEERPRYASAQVRLALDGAPGDERTRANMSRRLVYAPSKEELADAYGAARRGGVGSPLILEAVFPSMFDRHAAPERGQVVSLLAHPVALLEEPPAEFRAAVERAVRETFERIAPGAGRRIVSADVRLPADLAKPLGAPVCAFAGAASVLPAWSRARALTGASGVAGYFFCGPEAQIGAGLSGAAGRRAAEAAIRHHRKKLRS
jgi:phytoene dehydrogenase-like protein